MDIFQYFNLTAAVQWVNGTGTSTIDFAKAAPVMAVIVFAILWFLFGRK